MPLTEYANGKTRAGLMIVIGVIGAVGVIGAMIARDNATATIILGFCGLIETQLLALLVQVRANEVISKSTVEVVDAVKEVKVTLAETAEAVTARADAADVKLEEIVKVVAETKDTIKQKDCI